jgi:hypothetical protein
LKTGTAVKYDPGAKASLNTTNLNSTTTSNMRVLDGFTIKLFATQADATAARSSFNPRRRLARSRRTASSTCPASATPPP